MIKILYGYAEIPSEALNKSISLMPFDFAQENGRRI
jgi:hypothetical protein